MSFGKGFKWGAATASYQVEGGVDADGRGPSVWDMMCRKENAIWSKQTGDVACDHYHRYREDVRLMRDIGLKAYRFSVSWSRVFPEGTGKVNARGLAFYDRLVDELLKAGVEPFLTLFHWDYPYALYTRGGWLNPDSPDWFADYATTLASKLGDRVTHWMTHNEPQCFIGLGHQQGTHAPGDRLGWTEVLRATHHALLAHGKGVRAIRAAAPRRVKVGMAPVGFVQAPASESKADVAAARQAMFSITSPSVWCNTWWMDPMFLGEYPADGLKVMEPYLPRIGKRDMKIIHAPVDFCGVNIYSAERVRAGADGQPETVSLPDGHPLTAFSWTVVPESLYWGPRFLYERYGKPIYITENGMANADWVSVDGAVHDPQRIDFTTRYLRELERAVTDGADVRGYFHWTLMDNFEWAEGFQRRFGLIFVDYPTGRRIPKDSAAWYAEVIRTNGAVLGAGA
jgi:beta-glucosidase